MISIFDGRERGLTSAKTEIFIKVQVTIRNYLPLFRNGKNSDAWVVFTALATHINQEGWAWPSTKLLMRETAIKQPHSITAALHHLTRIRLEGQPVLRIYRRLKAGRYCGNVYHIFPEAGGAPPNLSGTLVDWTPHADHPDVVNPHAEPDVVNPHPKKKNQSLEQEPYSAPAERAADGGQGASFWSGEGMQPAPVFSGRELSSPAGIVKDDTIGPETGKESPPQTFRAPDGFGDYVKSYTAACAYCGASISQFEDRCPDPDCRSPITWENSPVFNKLRKRQKARAADRKAKEQRDLAALETPPSEPATIRLVTLSGNRMLPAELQQIRKYEILYGPDRVIKVIEYCKAAGSTDRGLIKHVLNTLASRNMAKKPHSTRRSPNWLPTTAEEVDEYYMNDPYFRDAPTPGD